MKNSKLFFGTKSYNNTFTMTDSDFLSVVIALHDLNSGIRVHVKYAKQTLSELQERYNDFESVVNYIQSINKIYNYQF